jgi:hypothetical protein
MVSFFAPFIKSLTICVNTQIVDECQRENKDKWLRTVDPGQSLIITSGDTSDVDGFLALAQYSKVVTCIGDQANEGNLSLAF